jgi:predicted nuclease of predicted toxin-antitoxin system
MKILLDESLPKKLKKEFGLENEVLSVRDMEWLEQKNGTLLKLMIESGFEVFVTVDRNLQYQQNLERLPLTIVVLCALNNRLGTLSALIPKMFDRISLNTTDNVIVVE